jgi:thioesterase domain-containing protein
MIEEGDPWKPETKTRAVKDKTRPWYVRTKRALNSYEAQPYPGRITLFRTPATKHSWMFHNEPYLGWDRVAGGGVEVHEVPGEHSTLLEEPQVQVLAARLKTCLEQARTSSS